MMDDRRQYAARALAAILLAAVLLFSLAYALQDRASAAAKPPTPPPCPTIPPAPTPTPTPTPTPSPTPTPVAGWTLAFDDQFSTWDDSRYFIYGDPEDGAGGWTDTSHNGTYRPEIIASDGSKLRINIKTEAGLRKVAAFIPQIPGALSARGDLDSMRWEARIRADRMLGYKGVPLLWPMSGVWPRDGEIDGPESNFDQRPSAFMHRQDATASNDQDFYAYPTGTSWQDWHVYTLEWIDGTSAEFFIDGVSIGKSTARVPNTPMHLVMQFETQLSGGIPDPAVAGFVEIDYLRVWSR